MSNDLDNPTLEQISNAGERPQVSQKSPLPFVDLERVLAGDCRPPRPTLAAIDGGSFLFYAGKLNELHGEPAIGKTNVELAAAKAIIEAGGEVVFIDPEDVAETICSRLLSFGMDPDRIIRRFRYIQNPEPGDFEAAHKFATACKPAAVFIDGIAQMLANLGLSENDPADFLPFCSNFLRPFTDAGCAVIVSDHVTKDKESRGQWARGTGAKLGRYDGAVYEVRLVEPYGPAKEGKVRLIVSKDRNGGIGPRGTVAAEIHFTPGEDGTDVAIAAPDGTGFRPTALMEKVSREVEANPEVSLRELRKLGKAQYVNQAIDTLEDLGFLKIHRQGMGLPNRYEMLNPYRDE